MKSEHRHELAENDLSKLLDKGRDRIEPHRNKILLGLLIATVVIVGGIVVYRTQGTADIVGSAELAAATTAADYDKVAADFEGTTVGLWARLRAGEEHLGEGIRLSLSNRSASNDSLEAAQQAFDQVLRANNVASEVREKALYGLAVTLESLTSEQTTAKPAVEQYQRLLKEFPDSSFKPQAEARIQALEQPSAVEFYAWFHAQNPKPDDRPQPLDFPQMPFGEDTANPFLDSEPPPDMPADVRPSTDADAAAPADAVTEPPPPPTSERSAEESEGPSLPPTPDSSTEPAAADDEPAPSSGN